MGTMWKVTFYNGRGELITTMFKHDYRTALEDIQFDFARVELSIVRI